jgi:two-component system sensor histidine kinase/response regulator
MELNEKINILIVDDYPENLLALEAILDRLEQNIVKAMSGEEALNCLLDQDFALILLDVQMPGIDGFETAQLIREREKTKNTPIIFLTAINRNDLHVSRGYSLGAVDYIFKPFDPEILISKVKVFVELAKKTRDLRQQLSAYKELEAFTYSISHDLGAPLRMINSFSGLLLNKYSDKLDKDGQEFLNIISSQALQMKQLIDDLLNFSKISQKEMEKTNINMTDLAWYVVESIQKLHSDHNVKVNIADLPEAVGDRSMIKQVLINLVNNAFKYSKTKENPVIEINSFTRENEVYYNIEDNGVGFDMQYSHKIFDVFRRLHTDGEFEGTGIGLAIVRRIIQKHGGKIFATGKVNEGARFYFTLPQVREQ